MFNQILVFLDNNLDPAKGGKVQISINENVEKLKAFIFDKEINSYSYILCFTKENIDTKDTFKAAILSGFSGLEYKLDIDITSSLYDDIKQAYLAADASYMRKLQEAIEAIVVPEIPKPVEPGVDVE